MKRNENVTGEIMKELVKRIKKEDKRYFESLEEDLRKWENRELPEAKEPIL